MSRHPAAWLSEGESKKPQDAPPRLLSLPALSGSDCASTAMYCKNNTHMKFHHKLKYYEILNNTNLVILLISNKIFNVDLDPNLVVFFSTLSPCRLHSQTYVSVKCKHNTLALRHAHINLYHYEFAVAGNLCMSSSTWTTLSRGALMRFLRLCCKRGRQKFHWVAHTACTA